MFLPKNIDNFLFPQSVQEAIEIQKSMRSRIITSNQFTQIKIIAGIDTGYSIQKNLNKACIALFTYPELTQIHSICAEASTNFPYVPGLLSFREIPVILKTLENLPLKPDLLMVDGHGIAHPRRMGIATHLGVITKLPTIGVAKKKLCGKYNEPKANKGAYSYLNDKNEIIGMALRSKDNVKPIFISTGNMIDLETAQKYVVNCLKQHKLPEPTRMADKLSKFKN